MFTSRIVQRVCELSCIVLVLLPTAFGDNGTSVVKDNKVDVDPYKFIGTGAQKHSGRQLFDFRKNGIQVDVRVVPAPRNDSIKNDDNDGFPEFPTKDIGYCIISFSLVCAKRRFDRFLESIRELNEIYLMGPEIKLVKTRVISDRRSSNDSSIERSIDDIFDTFALRVTLPRWNGKREKNQIDIMLDETALSEGRGKGGGGKGGSKGGGKCKMMMMAGLMMLKLKLIGIATMKGMMMGGMSLLMSMAMLLQKYMKGGGGGGHGGGGGGQYKEIVLLTKSSGGGGGGGGGGCCPPADSYGAPPPSSYGPPSGGGGYGGGGGGGWGRSFGRRFITTNQDRNYTADAINSSPTVEKPTTDVGYQNHGDPMGSNFVSSKWNLSNDGEAQRYQDLSNSGSNLGNVTDAEPLLRLGLTNYAVETDPYQNVDSRDYIVESNPSGYMDNVNPAGSTNYIANSYDTNVARPIYADEWQATSENILPSNLKRETLESG